MAGARSQDRGRKRAADEHSAQGASPWEWVTAAVGLVLLAAALGWLAYSAIAIPDGPPKLTFEQGAVETSGDGYVIGIVVRNVGASTASAVEIEGTLSRDGAVQETSTMTLDYVPRMSERTGGLYFATDPRDGSLELRPKGYVEP